LLLRWKQMMPARDRASSLAQSFQSEHFTADRTDKLFACSIAGAAEETT
jgi:hypothetical protein